MGRAAVSYRFRSAPSTARYYPRALLGRRVALLPAGRTLPRLEGEVESVKVDPRHVARFRDICGYVDDGCLPIAYPHVLAMPLHIAIATHPLFQLRLMGLVHLANEICWLRPLPLNRAYRVACWVEGHRETDRGQEVDLHTSLSDGEGLAWSESSTLLARGSSRGAAAARTARALLRAPRPAAQYDSVSLQIPAGRSAGRRYGFVSGDLNPIHLSNWSARRYGFERAVAHGMWTMARSLAALGPQLTVAPTRIGVQFKLPLFLPGVATLEHWREPDRWLFVLTDQQRQRPYLTGLAEPL